MRQALVQYNILVKLLCCTYFLTLDVRGVNDVRLISRPVHAPSHELEDIGTDTPLTKIVRRFWLSYWALEKESFYSVYGV